VVGAPLHDHVTRAQQHFAVVQDQRQLALDHHHIVERARAVHDGARTTGAQRVHIQQAQQVAGGGHEGKRSLVGLLRLGRAQRGHGLRHVPHLGEIGTHGRAAHRVVLRRRAVRQHDGLAGGVMAGDDATGGVAHGGLLGKAGILRDGGNSSHWRAVCCASGYPAIEPAISTVKIFTTN